jgi:hypothetical protein
MTRHELGSLVVLILFCAILVMAHTQKCVEGVHGPSLSMELAVLCIVVSAGAFLLGGNQRRPPK